MTKTEEVKGRWVSWLKHAVIKHTQFVFTHNLFPPPHPHPGLPPLYTIMTVYSLFYWSKEACKLSSELNKTWLFIFPFLFFFLNGNNTFLRNKLREALLNISTDPKTCSSALQCPIDWFWLHCSTDGFQQPTKYFATAFTSPETFLFIATTWFVVHYHHNVGLHRRTLGGLTWALMSAV